MGVRLRRDIKPPQVAFMPEWYRAGGCRSDDIPRANYLAADFCPLYAALAKASCRNYVTKVIFPLGQGRADGPRRRHSCRQFRERCAYLMGEPRIGKTPGLDVQETDVSRPQEFRRHFVSMDVREVVRENLYLEGVVVFQKCS